MDRHDKEIPPGEILPVVVIGNGPSGICLSYLLSGYTPYLSPEASHPNPLLHSKLGEQPHLSLLEQDLEYLCEGLEGRSSNPMAVLFDSLLLPDSDFGLDHTSPLEWRYEPERAVPHLVLGKGPPGGAWHAMEGSMLTLSLANWMELPGLKLKDWMREKRRNVRNDRATPAEIASYYQHYVSQMSLEQNFACGTAVTSVTRQPGGLEGSPPCWRVTGLQRREREELGDGCAVSEEVPFSFYAHNVVLATGTHDIPARLGVEGESLPYVCHSFWELEAAISRGELDQSSDPVLVVGAGLTAADAVLAAHHLNTPVYHAFRRSVSDPGLIFNQLPKLLYPEYHKVHQMMTQQQYQPDPPPQEHAHSSPSSLPSPSPSTSSCPSSYPGYLSFPRYRVAAFRPDRKCVLESDLGQRTVVQISKALVLIGAHPNLSFLADNGRSLGVNPEEPITCRRNPVEVHPFTNRVVAADGPGLYAMGPLVGENFVRFLKGGALAIASDLAKTQRERALAAVKREFSRISERKTVETSPLDRPMDTPVFDSALDETLRLTAAPFITREVVQEKTLNMANGQEYLLRKGDRVCLFPFNSPQMDPEIHDEPQKFKYDRFLNQDGSLKKDFYKRGRLLKYYSMPWGAGTNGCVGKQFAINTIRQFVYVALTSYDLELCDPNARMPAVDASRYGFGMLQPEGDLPVRYKPKNTN